MNPYRTAAAAATSPGWLTRREDIVWGELRVTYTRHRWYWTAYLRAQWWLTFHEWGQVQFKRND